MKFAFDTPAAPSFHGGNSTTTTHIPITAPLSPSHTQTFSSAARYNNSTNGDLDYEYDSLDNDTLDVFAYDSTLAGYTTSYSFASSSSRGGGANAHLASHGYANGSSSSNSLSSFVRASAAAFSCLTSL